MTEPRRVRATARGYDNQRIREPGEIFDWPYAGPLGSWMEVVDDDVPVGPSPTEPRAGAVLPRVVPPGRARSRPADDDHARTD